MRHLQTGTKHVLISILIMMGLGNVSRAQQTGPDLIVSDFWEQNHQVRCQIKNTGTTLCPGGHVVGLSVDNKLQDTVAIQDSIAPGKALTVTFPKFYWACTQGGQFHLSVCADVYTKVKETNESNNCRQETWVCDLTAPKILSGPNAQNIGLDAAQIVWTTDESSDSSVRIGTKSQVYTEVFFSQMLRTQHVINLNGLTQDTKYYYVVESTDGSGNTVKSKEETFQTLAPAPQLPDLVVSLLRISNHGVSGTLLNQGEATAPAGHVVRLSMDGTAYDEVPISVPLAPGETADFRFPKFYFQCMASSHTLVARADTWDRVDEEDEGNNTRPFIVLCEEPLAITAGPTVKVAAKHASITWSTNLDANSLCEYGTAAGLYGQTETQSERVRTHNTMISGLLPGTTYQYRVSSEDQYGNRVQSRPAYFTTEAPTGVPPMLLSLDVTREPTAPLTFRMAAEAKASSGMAHVQFYMDGQLVGTDYAEPYEFLVTPAMLGETRETFFQEHSIRAVAVDRSRVSVEHFGFFDPPYECSEITARFIEPFPNETLYIPGVTVPTGTTLPITVYAAELDWDCWISPIGDAHGEHPLICDEATLDVHEVRFYVNTVHLGTVTESTDDVWREHQFSLDWLLDGTAVGEYHLRVDAVVDDDCIQTLTRDIHIVTGSPSLTVERRVTRNANVFDVELILRNHGTVSYHCDRIRDCVNSFQPIAKTETNYAVTLDSSDNGLHCDITIEAGDSESSTVEIRPGRSFTASYQVVPIRFIGRAFSGPEIGIHAVEVEGSPSVEIESFERRCVLTEDSLLLSVEVEQAIADANYLLVTNPEALTAHYGAAESVLSTMAELAQARQGVLGYAFGPSADDEDWVRDSAIRIWGADMTGSDGRAGQYLSNGYLLLVGETEILPAWEVDIEDAVYGDKRAEYVYFSDAPYADMSGGDLSPELITGRIIGDSPGQLIQGMRNSLDATFDRSLGIVTSGSEGEWENFVGSGYNVTVAWRDQELAGSIMQDGFKAHHWSRYIHKHAVEGYAFPMDAGDGFLCANVNGSQMELVRLDPGVHQAKFAMYSTLDLLDSPFYYGPHCSFDTGDAIAAGDIDGDGEDETVIGAMTHDQIIIGFDHAEPSTRDTAFAVTLNPWDVITCGDLVGDAREEIVVANRRDHGTVEIYGYSNTGSPTLTLLDTLDYIPFAMWDGLAVGDVDSTRPGNEIILGNASDDLIMIYNAAGTFLGEFPCDPYTAYDAMAVGDLDADGLDEIAVIIDDTRDSKRRLKVFQNDCWENDPNEGWRLRNNWHSTIYSRFLDFHGIRTTSTNTRYDGFVAADIDADGKDELCLAKEGDDRLYILDGHYSQGWKDRYMPHVTADDSDIDLFTLRGHGNVNSLSPFVTGDIASFNFSANPLVLGLSCLTGGYEGQWKYVDVNGPNTLDLGDAAFANAFFDQGAAVYIGATEVSSTTMNGEAGPGFFRAWDRGETAGKAFRDYERSKISSDGWRRWVIEYNYYGDPKFGALDATGRLMTVGLPMVGQAVPDAPPNDPNRILVTLEDYLVDEVDGLHHISIPEGGHLTQHGKPVVPSIVIEHPLPAGALIQDVHLVKRSDMIQDKGLNLPLGNTNPELAGESLAAPTPVFAGWFPIRPFDWHVMANGDGSRTLVLELYPFLYNNVTGEAQYYRTIEFELEILHSTVSIAAAQVDPTHITQGSQAHIDMSLNNSGSPQDVIVNATIKRYGTGELHSGLIVDRLDTVTGQATYNSLWDSTDQEPGHYILDLSISAPDGTILDRRTRLFEVGTD